MLGEGHVPTQIVYDLEKKKCVNGYADGSKYMSHLVCADHKPKLIPGTVQTFLCDTCGARNNYRPTSEEIYIGGGIGDAEKMLGEGRIKPAYTLESEIARIEKINSAHKNGSSSGEKSYEEYKRAQFKKLGLRFYEPRPYESTDKIVEGRPGDKWESDQFRTHHNFRVIEMARRDYMLGVKKLQEELAQIYNPQFIQENYDDQALNWNVRQDIIAEIWGEHRNVRKD